MVSVAILVDGAFYQKRAFALFGEKAPEERAQELFKYCLRHVKNKEDAYEWESKSLYRIFYYDCPPSEKTVFHPLSQKNISLKHTDTYKWQTDFQKALISKRKLALRRGELLESNAGYILRPDTLKKLLRHDIELSELTDADFVLDIKQKGVDMRIGLDIASLAYKHQVQQIVLIAGDSDFVPAAKHARREGIDFILDPMWHPIKDSLNEHIDGLVQRVDKPPHQLTDPLCCLPTEYKKDNLGDSHSSNVG